jgi:hypothetical protein
MAGLTGPRDTKQYGGSPFGVLPETLQFTVTNGSTLYEGALATVVAAGTVQPSAATTNGKIAGRCEPGNGGVSSFVGNAGGTVYATCRQGVFMWDINTGGGAITAATFGSAVYAFDDHTVTLTSEDVIAGTFYGLDSLTGTQAMVLSLFGVTLP